jgi:hypothetical protein
LKDAGLVVIQFNHCITHRDLDGLTALMSDDHVFIDSANNRVEGKAACTAAWRSFFEAFPDYRNEFERVRSLREDAVMSGRSICSDPLLDGPALWTAKVNDGLVSEWRVLADTPANRAAIGL